MEVKFIPCKSIDVPKVSAEIRSFSKEFAVELANSIKVDTQKVPIAVRPNPDDPTRYVLINGRHRLYAIKNVLKMDLISARVFDDMGEVEAGLARDVEQLWASPLNDAQHMAALKRWHAHWLKTLPPIVPDKPTEYKPRDKRSPDGTPIPDPAPEPTGAAEGSGASAPFDSTEPSDTKARGPYKPDSHKVSAFDQKVADVTGQTARNVKLKRELSRKFSDEELEVFSLCDVTQSDMQRIADIPDKGQRAHVINLVAAGATTDQAIKEVCGAEAPKSPNDSYGARGIEKAAKAEAAKETLEPEMTDDAWFEFHCGEKAKYFRNTHRYKADAILFRKVADTRSLFRSKHKALLKDIKKRGVNGSFWGLVNRFISVSHPKDWFICPDCKGTGVKDGTPEDQHVKPNCKKCFGSGYLLKTEEWQ